MPTLFHFSSDVTITDTMIKDAFLLMLSLRAAEEFVRPLFSSYTHNSTSWSRQVWGQSDNGELQPQRCVNLQVAQQIALRLLQQGCQIFLGA
jgi:hypothetical protein